MAYPGKYIDWNLVSDLVDEGFLSSQIEGLGWPESQETFLSSLIVWALEDKELVARVTSMLEEANLEEARDVDEMEG